MTDRGLRGADGADGRAGRAGADGADGRAGTDGRDGLAGADGPAGVDGAGYTPEQIAQVIRQLRQLVVAFVLVGGLVVGWSTYTSWSGRQQIVVTQRRSCNIGASIYTRYINDKRANYIAALAIANDSFQSKKTRDARRTEAGRIIKTIRFFTSILDHSHYVGIDDPTDREAVRTNGVSCSLIYKDASFLP
jgi:hypothetical protein